MNAAELLVKALEAEGEGNLHFIEASFVSDQDFYLRRAAPA